MDVVNRKLGIHPKNKEKNCVESNSEWANEGLMQTC